MRAHASHHERAADAPREDEGRLDQDVVHAERGGQVGVARARDEVVEAVGRHGEGLVDGQQVLDPGARIGRIDGGRVPFPASWERGRAGTF